jgi:predicted small metal-binding protein
VTWRLKTSSVESKIKKYCQSWPLSGPAGLVRGIVVEEPGNVIDERGGQMAKLLRCKDVGFDCAHEIRAETEEELMKKVAEHAGEVHDLTEISEEVVAEVKAAIKDE